MRLVLRLALVLAVGGVLALGALALALPRLVASGAVRERIRAAGLEAVGAELDFESLDFGLLPPRLVVRAPRAAAPGGGEPLLVAERIDLELRLLPLLTRAVVVDSLAVEGARLRLVRTAEGLVLPRPPPRPEVAAAEAPPAAGAPQGGGGGFALAVAALELRRSGLRLEDRTVAPPVVWELEDVSLDARGEALDRPIDLELEARLASGGRVTARGRAALDGQLDLELRLAEVGVAPVASYLPRLRGLGGLLSGTLRVQGPASAPRSLAADLVLGDARLELEDMSFAGRLVVKAELAAGAAGLAGPFEIDATEAAVRYGGFFEKPPGTAATASGRLVAAAGGELEVEDVRLRVRDFEAKARLRTGRLELEAPPFALEGLAPLVPPLAAFAPEGRAALEGVSVATAPLDLRGRLTLPAMRARLAGGEPVALRGALVAEGTRVLGRELEASVGGQRVPLDLELSGLGGAPRYRVALRTEGAELDALLRGLGGRVGSVSGPLTSQVVLSGPLSGGEGLRAAAGRADLAVGRGRLRGVSLLRGAVERLGAFGEAALLAGAARGGSTLQRFYEDEFESLTGSFDVADGLARTRDLRLVYRHYRVDLHGSLSLLDGRLDLAGTLRIDPELDAALAGAEARAAREQVIPLARITGRFDAPRIDLTRDAVLALAGRYASETRRGDLEREIDERLGQGSGSEVLDALEGLLGPREKR